MMHPRADGRRIFEDLPTEVTEAIVAFAEPPSASILVELREILDFFIGKERRREKLLDKKRRLEKATSSDGGTKKKRLVEDVCEEARGQGNPGVAVLGAVGGSGPARPRDPRRACWQDQGGRPEEDGKERGKVDKWRRAGLMGPP